MDHFMEFLNSLDRAGAIANPGSAPANQQSSNSPTEDENSIQTEDNDDLQMEEDDNDDVQTGDNDGAQMDDNNDLQTRDNFNHGPVYWCPPLPEKPTNIVETPRFMEGDEELRTFPEELMQQMEENCSMHNITRPTCLRAHWPTPAPRLDANPPHPFVLPETEEVLLAARYSYPPYHQVLVVKQSSGDTFMNGKPAIIVHHRRATIPAVETSNDHNWLVWDPS